MNGQRTTTLLLIGADAGALGLLRPHPAQLLGRLGAPREWLVQTPDAALAEVAATLLWLVAVWIGIGIAVTLLARLPGVVGRACSATSTRLLPATLRRVVAGSVGLSVVLTPLSFTLGALAPATAQSAPAFALPAPVWPGADGSAPAGRPDPAARGPSVPAPPQLARQEGRPAVVRPGDSLWLIAARRLGPAAGDAEVSAAWPRWYAANRDRIGADPDLIQPGQRLRPPGGGPQS
ncbi:MAG: hypothetical protein QOI15_1612 [Pseudonocardiales bacterium]|nr:hypothetical protein [Pseudonocardiales bacterium]